MATMTASGAPKTARARARALLTEEIKASARTQLAEVGAASLSVRAVARDLGMASSAVYRYFPGRDELLTALIVDAYGDLATAAETAVAASAGRPFAERWLELTKAVRGWALANRHEYALIYGSPVPGYAAPQDTVAPAIRIATAMGNVLESITAAGDGQPQPKSPNSVPPNTVPPMTGMAFDRIAEATGTTADHGLFLRGTSAWTQLFGHISFELFGQFNQTVEDYDEFFDTAMAYAAHAVEFGQT